MNQAALSGGQSLGEGGLLLGGGGGTFAWGGGNPRFPTPLYETLILSGTSRSAGSSDGGGTYVYSRAKTQLPINSAHQAITSQAVQVKLTTRLLEQNSCREGQ